MEAVWGGPAAACGCAGGCARWRGVATEAAAQTRLRRRKKGEQTAVERAIATVVAREEREPAAPRARSEGGEGASRSSSSEEELAARNWKRGRRRTASVCGAGLGCRRAGLEADRGARLEAGGLLPIGKKKKEKGRRGREPDLLASLFLLFFFLNKILHIQREHIRITNPHLELQNNSQSQISKPNAQFVP